MTNREENGSLPKKCYQYSKIYVNYFIFALDFTKVDVENPPTDGAKITMYDLSQMKSFCVRYYLESLTNQQIFSSPKYELTLLMYFVSEVGFVAMKGAWSIFPIPRQIKPYTYEHICYSHNMTHYIVAAEGEIWFIGMYSLIFDILVLYYSKTYYT